jgi:ribosomal protein S18 acetylase RimI-like enzyme
MNTRCVVIESELNDLRHCRSLISLVNAYRTHPMGGNLPEMTPEAQRDIIRGLRNHPTSLVLFANYGKTIAGAAVCFIGFGTFSAKPLLNVHDLIVAPRFQGKGIGKTIMEAIIKKAEALGCCKVTLEVRSDNAVAKRLYRGLGFGPCPSPMEFWTKPLVPSKEGHEK